MDRAALRFRPNGAAAASLLVNGLIVAALLGLQIGPKARPPAAPAMTVVSLAAPKGAEEREESAEANLPHSAPAEVMSETHAADSTRPKPEEIAAPILPPLLLGRPVEMPRSTNLPPADLGGVAATAQPSAPTGAPAPSPPARGSRGIADGIETKAPTGTSRSYAAKVRSWLYAHKTYPRHARMRRQEGLVQVRFVLDRAGVLLESAITRRSGITALDEEAQAMMRRSSPYPQAPADLPGERIEFTAPIEFSLPS